MSLIPIYSSTAVVSHATARHPESVSILSFNTIPESTTIVPGDRPGSDSTVKVFESSAPMVVIEVSPNAIVIDPLDRIAVHGRVGHFAAADIMTLAVNGTLGFRLRPDKLADWRGHRVETEVMDTHQNAEPEDAP